MRNIGLLILILTVAIFGARAAVWLDRETDCGVAHAEAEYEATAVLKLCAIVGRADAQMHFGLLYWSEAGSDDRGSYGLNAGLSEEEANRVGWRLLRAAAEGGSAPSMNEIGYAYYMGHNGAAVDFGAARYWFEQAEEAGDELAGFNLARMYARGSGVEADLQLALDHLASSARRGYEPARCMQYRWKEYLPEISPDVRLAMFATFIGGSTAQSCTEQDLMSPVDVLFEALRRRAGKVARSLNTIVDERRFLASAQQADVRSCAVYRDFFDEHSGGERVFLAPTTRLRNYRPSEDDLEDPWIFSRETGDFEIIEREWFDKPIEVPVLEPFEFDASPLWSFVTSGPQLDIEHCFKDSAGERTVWPSTLAHLYLQERRAMIGDDLLLKIWTVSRVGFSVNGEYALIYLVNYCGGLCGGGSFVLLQQSAQSRWAIIGFQNVWVS